MTPAATPEALVDGADDMPTDAEIKAMREEAENFRLPAPPPMPVRGRYYLTECEHCGWVGSSENCGGNYGPDDDDVVCPVCCSSICGDEPDEADTAKHGEAVYQRIVAAESALATATAEAASLRAEVEALKGALKAATDKFEAVCNAISVAAERERAAERSRQQEDERLRRNPLIRGAVETARAATAGEG